MNQTCKVCGEPAAGFHFGAFTCEGCKSFFGRSYNNPTSMSECKNNGQCVINKKNRTACKACRLQKCFLVGMSKSGSRYGRRSNWFKIHCLLQEQQQVAAAAAAAAHGNQKTPPPAPSSLSMLGHPGSYPPGMYAPRQNPTKEELMLLGLEEYSKHPSASPSVSSPDSHNSDSSVDINVRSNSLLRKQPIDSSSPMSKELGFLPLPFAALSSLHAMPPPGFLPPSHLLFPGYHPSLYSHHQGLLKPAAEHPSSQHSLLNNTHLANNNSRYTPNNNNNNNNHIIHSSKAAEELTKRFYLEAVLKSQQRSPPPSLSVATTISNNTDSTALALTNHHNSMDTKSDEEPDVESEDVIVHTITPPRSPNALLPLAIRQQPRPGSSDSPIQDNPIDLSMKNGSSSGSSIQTTDDNRNLSGGESDLASEDDETTTTTITTTIEKRHHSNSSNSREPAHPYSTNHQQHRISVCARNDDDPVEYERDMKRLKMQATSTTTPLDLTTKV